MNPGLSNRRLQADLFSKEPLNMIKLCKESQKLSKRVKSVLIVSRKMS